MDEQISRLNVALRPFKFVIEKTISDADNLTYYVLVNLASNDVTISTSIQNPKNVESFHHILEKLLTSETNSLSREEVENEIIVHSKKQKKTNTMLKPLDSEELVDSWLRSNLLHCSQDSEITIGFVALAEFSYWIQSNHPNVAKKCALCQSIVVGGDECSLCHESLHTSCKKKIQRGKKCPKCR